MSVPNQTPLKESIANGVTKVFPYDFYVILADDLKVYANGVLVAASLYTITGIGQTQGGNVTFTTAPANGTRITLKRETPVRRDTQYSDNGDLLADTVNDDFDRLWLSLQEQRTNFGSSMTKPVGIGNWNAQGFAIENLKDGVGAQDAVTYNQLMTVNASAGQSASTASAAATAAVSARNDAQSARTDAISARDTTLGYRNTATGAATTATNAAQAAAISESNANTFATNAFKWAANARGVLVDSTYYSAMSYALDGKDYRDAALAYRDAAAASAALAQQYQPNTALQIMPNLITTDTPDSIRAFGRYGVSGATAATTAKGYPVNSFIGSIDVMWGPNGTQQIAFHNNGTIYTRYLNGAWNGTNGPWSAWSATYGVNNKPSAADVGALALTGGNVTGNATFEQPVTVNAPGNYGYVSNTTAADASGQTGRAFLIKGSSSQYDIQVHYRLVDLQYHCVRFIQNGAETFRANSNGACYAVSFNPTSDSRLKFDKLFISDALTKSLTLRGMTYRIQGESKAGVIAQDVQAVLPQSVSVGGEEIVLEDGSIIDDQLSLDYAGVTALNTEALKEVVKLMLECLTDPDAAKEKLIELVAAINTSTADANETSMKMEWALVDQPTVDEPTVDEPTADE